MATKTHISSTTRVRGSITGGADLALDGHVEGDIRLEGDLDVNTEATVDGNINARTVVINGTIKGNIEATEHLTVSKTARIKGSLCAPILRLEDGALVSGEFNIGKPNKSNRNASNKSTKSLPASSRSEAEDEDTQLPEGVVARKVKVKG